MNEVTATQFFCNEMKSDDFLYLYDYVSELIGTDWSDNADGIFSQVYCEMKGY